MIKTVPITFEYPTVVDIIKTHCGVCGILQNADDETKIENYKQYNALWDTGASTTCISRQIVKDLKLESRSVAFNYTAGGKIISNIYCINLLLPNRIVIKGLFVACCDLDDTDILIGMDVITQGDMAISNYEGKTTFSFRVPTAEKIDFEKENNNKSNN